MVSEITRGVKFRFSTELDPGAAKALEAIEKRVDALQKRMHLTLDVTERGGRSGTGNGSAGGGRNGQTAIDAAARAAERAMQLRERAAERAMRTEARWSRMAEAAVAKRERDEARAADKTEREAKRAAESQIRELRRVESERQRARAAEFREAAARQRTEARRGFRSDADFWQSFEQYGEDRARTRIQQEREQQRRHREEQRERRTAERDYDNRIRAGNRQLAQLVRSGPQAVAHDERVARQEQQRAQRETELAQRRQEEAQTRIREGVYGTVHAFGQLTRAAAQFGLVGQRDMARVLDTIFAVEGGINALQGGMNAFRAIRSIREARAGMGPGAGAVKYAAGLARLGSASGGAVGAGGAGGIGLGTIGLAGAGATALAAGGVGLLGTIADRRRGVPGQVGGFWDTVGGAINAPVGFVNRGLMGVGSRLERSFNEPYGLTQFQSEERSLRLHESEFNRDFGGEEGANESYYAAKKRADLAEERTQLLERRTQARLGARAGMRDLRGTIYADVGAREAEQRQLKREFEAQRHGARAANIEARSQNIAGQLGVAFGRQQEFHGELAGLRARQAAGEFVDPAQMARAAAEQAREEGLVASFAQRQRNNLTAAHVANFQRGRGLAQDLGAARQRQAALGEFDTAEKEGAAREILNIEEQIKQNAEERAQIAERLRRTEIDGAQRELALRQQSLAAAKQAAEGLRGQRQSAIERFGNLNPMQRRATIQAAQMFKQGIELQEPQLDLLRNFQEVFGPQLRARAEKKFKEEGGAELFKLGGFDQRVAAAEAREKQEIDLSVNARNEIAIKLDANTDAMAKALEGRVVPIFKSMMQEAVNAIEERLHMARGQDFGQGVERANAAGGP